MLRGDRISPVKHLVLKMKSDNREEDKATMTKVVNKVRRRCSGVIWNFLATIFSIQARQSGVALVMASYLEDAEARLPPVSIRLTASTLVSLEEIAEAAKTVTAICQEVFGDADY